ncbi:hypothetical protein JCM3770_005847 [Rhodotorula araucariae]
MSSNAPARTDRVFAERDEVLSSRLRALGYSLARPTPPASPDSPGGSSDEDPFQGAPPRNALQVVVNQVEEITLRMKRVKEGDGRDDTVSEASSPIEFGGSSPEATPLPITSSRSGPPSLHDLLQLVAGHREKALEGKKQNEGRKKRHEKKPPPVTPRKDNANKLEGLRLNSSPATTPVSPQKRRRRPSTPSTPCPPADLSTPIHSNHPAGSSDSSSRSFTGSPSSPSPVKRVTRHLPHILALLSLSLRLVGATDSPLVDSAARFAELVPGVTFSELVDLAQSLRRDAPLLSLAHERTKAGGRTFESNLNFVGDHLFSTSPKKMSDPQRATLFLAKELNLYPPSSRLAAPVAGPLPRILSTRRSTCAQCESPLNLHKRPSRPVYLVEPASPASLVLVTSHICTNSLCRALHTPDHIEIAHGGRKIWLWEKEPAALKVGDRVFASGGFARHYRMLLLEQATSAGAFASLWNQLYRTESPGLPLAPENEDGSSSEGSSSEGDAGEQPSRAPSTSLVLRQRHVWRAFVIYSTTLAAAASPHGQFASLARPSTEHLVALANNDMFGSTQDAASVLPQHSCNTCTRRPRIWRRGPATEEERARGVRWTGTHAKEGTQYFEDTRIVGGPDVQFAVCDGIEIGHPLCAVPFCSNPPEAVRRSRRFCSTHVHLHLVCGVAGCARERSDCGEDDVTSEACSLAAHQDLWRAYAERRRVLKERGWLGRRSASSRKYTVRNIEAVDAESSLQLYSDDDEEDLWAAERGSGEEEEKLPRGAAVAHTWSLRRTSNLQILVGACGAPLAWTKFANGETAPEVVSFLSSVHKQVGSHFPTYVAYDRACHVLRDVLASADKATPLPPFLSSSRLVVTAFHKRGHPAEDDFCDEFCTPTPLDGQAQDLVVPFRRVTRKGKYKKGEPRTFERAFNTSAAEQLNSTISRFAPLLLTLRADNFDFLIHVLLRHRKAEVERKAA